MDDKKGIKTIFDFMKKRGTSLLLVMALCLLSVMFFQNREMILKMDKYLSTSEEVIHEIYDDTIVLEAYKSGTKEGLGTEESFVFDKIVEVLGEIITGDMTDYEKEKAVYDWLFYWVRNTGEELNPIQSSADNFTPYGVFKSRSAICVGNATTFKLFMGALDIPCKIIHSTENGEHAWNVVQLDDEWYHVDISFDTGAVKPNYDCLNVPDSIKDNGEWYWNHEEIPACNGYKYSYLYQNGKDCADIYQIPEMIADARDRGENNIVLFLKDRTGFNTALANYIASGIFTNDAIIGWEGAYPLGGELVCLWRINDWNEEDKAIPEDIRNKIQEKIDRANENYNEYNIGGDYSDDFYGKG